MIFVSTVLTVILSGLLQSHAHEITDLEHVFKLDKIHRGDALVSAIQHEKFLKRSKGSMSLESSSSSSSSSMYISCTNYKNNNQLKSTLDDLMSESSYHPVYFSERADRVCYTFNSASIPTRLNRNGLRTTLVPHALKFGSEFHSTFDQLNFNQNENHGMFVMEFGIGVGVMGKGIRSSHTHESVFDDLMSESRNIQSNVAARTHHMNSFFWTSEKNSHLMTLSTSSSSSSKSIATIRDRLKQHYLQSFSTSCDFSVAQMETSQSHITLTMKLSSSSSSGSGSGSKHHLHPLCVLQLASIASLHSDITHVIFHSAEKILESGNTDQITELTSGPYDQGLPATDQNQYVQSGKELVTPYSDLGIDGSGYVLGMIDTGIDDLSCFLIDYSLTPTTRTPGPDYKNPITETFRRK